MNNTSKGDVSKLANFYLKPEFPGLDNIQTLFSKGVAIGGSEVIRRNPKTREQLEGSLQSWLSQSGFNDDAIQKIFKKQLVKRMLDEGGVKNEDASGFLAIVRSQASSQTIKTSKENKRTTLAEMGAEVNLRSQKKVEVKRLEVPESLRHESWVDVASEPKNLLQSWLEKNGFSDERIEKILTKSTTKDLLRGINTEDCKNKFIELLRKQAEKQMGIKK